MAASANGAEIARFVGQDKLSITADTYTHVLIEANEVDYGSMLNAVQRLPSFGSVPQMRIASRSRAARLGRTTRATPRLSQLRFVP
jgi:hypothetical protein